jgi:hypothetical protein
LASTDAEKEDQQLWHLVYASAATKGFAAPDLDAVLRVAREHNAGAEITGMLLFVDPSFLQVLEGTQDHIDELFERIRADRRHTRALLLLREPIEQRSFSEWTMGTTSATLSELQEAVGTNDFFQDRWDPLHHLGDTKLRKLLELFRSGSYRQRLT